MCDLVHHACIDQAQLDACAGKDPNASCTADAITGFCTDGVCLSQTCGDGLISGPEVCDDGNQIDGDGCSANCLSTELCGNLTVDFSKGEECDDGNHLDHDGCSSSCKLEQPHWIQHTVNPPPRNGPVMAYDSRRDRLVVFGGKDPANVYDKDTFEWNGADWIVVKTDFPPPGRVDGTMAYDRDHGVTVLFGGSTLVNTLADTWLWDGVSWASLDVAHAPPPRYAAAMAYDPKRHVTVLFGGQDDGNILDDTWEFDGSDWHEVLPSTKPPARDSAVMVFDPAIAKIVLVGGEPGNVTPIADTWTYDGSWHNVTNGTNPSVYAPCATYDFVGQRLVLFGGASSPVMTFNDTWTWNGTTWTKITALTPSARFECALASTYHQTLLFGGRFTSGLPTDTTYLLSANAWAPARGLGPRAAMGYANDPIRGRALLFGGETTTSTTANLSAETVTLSRTGLQLQTTPAGLTARAFPGVAYDFAHNNIVLFGGGSGSAATNDTWIWDGAAWSQKTVAAPPPARCNPAIAFDGVHVAMLAGWFTSFGAPRADSFTWDGTNWTSQPLVFGVLGDPAGGYSLADKKLVMFGGDGGNGESNLTYTYDDAALGHVPPQGNPPLPREGATMAWNAARQRLTMIGGNSSDTTDAFEWDGTTQHWISIPAASSPSPRMNATTIQSLDGAGIFVLGGFVSSLMNQPPPLDERWQLEWDAHGFSELCDGSDLDGDGLVRCDDPDCWPICKPLCPPGQTCDPAAPSCGDGVCDQRESCSTCPTDCNVCPSICGDGRCDTGESCPGDC